MYICFTEDEPEQIRKIRENSDLQTKPQLTHAHRLCLIPRSGLTESQGVAGVVMLTQRELNVHECLIYSSIIFTDKFADGQRTHD